MSSSAPTPMGSPVDAGAMSPSRGEHPQMLVLIGSDGGRTTVSRAIACEASYLLRELLDGQDFSGAKSGSTVRVRWENGGTGTGRASGGGGDVATTSVYGSSQVQINGLFASRVTAESPTNSDASDGDVPLGTLVEVRAANTSSRAAAAASSGSVVHTGTVVSVKTPVSSTPVHPAIDLDAELFGTAPPVKPAAKAVPDLMDFFGTVPESPNNPTATHDPTQGAAVAGEVKAGPNDDEDAWNDFLQTCQPHPASSSAAAAAVPAETRARAASKDTAPAATGTAPSSARPAPPTQPGFVELPFPYFRTDILERVCQHMSYRYRTSTFAMENGEVRVFCTQPREVPKPMIMPLNEYLDSQDRLFVSEWDETLTLEMLKAATLLNYDALYQLASAKLASFMVEKTVDGIRALLGVEGDFDAADEIELKKEQVVELPRV